MFDLLWDLHQQRRLGEISEDTRSIAQSSERDRRMLEERVDGLLLMNMAMWSILRDRLGVTDKELADRVQHIDLLDGRLDGRATSRPATCGSCKRTLSNRHKACMYCGGSLDNPDPFRSI